MGQLGKKDRLGDTSTTWRMEEIGNGGRGAMEVTAQGRTKTTERSLGVWQPKSAAEISVQFYQVNREVLSFCDCNTVKIYIGD